MIFIIDDTLIQLKTIKNSSYKTAVGASFI